MAFDVPVVLIVFNRPDTTRVVFDALRRVRPRQLTVIADAARPQVSGEAARCAETLSIATNVDWPCELVVDAADRNLGCRQRIATGLDAVFARHERAIVLEDDCLPAPAFFPFCHELLERYADDPRVMGISGDNFQDGRRAGSASYYFSRFMHVWGWATWRRAWARNDGAMLAWPRLRADGFLHRLFERRSAAVYFERKLDAVYEGRVSSWAFPWQLSCWREGGLIALPEVNLVSNIGFGVDATHTRRRSVVAGLPLGALPFPLVHPYEVTRDAVADQRTERRVFLGSRLWRIAARALDAWPRG